MANKRGTGTRSAVIRCPNCGEDYSVTYKRCPFCDEKAEEEKRQSGEHLDDIDEEESREGRGGRRLAGGRRGEPWTPLRIVGTVVPLVIIAAAIWIVVTQIMPLVNRGEMNQLPEDTADALSSLPKDVQERIKRVCPKKTPTADAIRRIRTKLDAGRDYSPGRPFTCPDGSFCTHSDKFFRHDLICCSWETCSGQKCCVECRAGGAHSPDGGTYNAACTEMCAKARKIYEQAKANKADQDAQKKSRARSKAAKKAMADAARIVRAADSAGVTDKIGRAHV